MKRFAIVFLAFLITGIFGFSAVQAPRYQLGINTFLQENKPTTEPPICYHSFVPDFIEIAAADLPHRYTHIPYVFPEREESIGMLRRSTEQKNFIIISNGTIYARDLEAGEENQPPKN